MLLKLRLDPADENLTGFASNVTGAGPWTPTSTTSGDNLAHQVSVRNDSANNHSGKTLTLTGTDADGRAQVEAMAGPGGSATVESTKYFLTLTSVAVSSTIGADTFDIGWVDEFVSATIPLDWRLDAGTKWLLDVTGTINVDVQFCLDDIPTLTDQNAAFWVEPASSLLAETADSSAIVEVAAGYTAARVQVNSYSSGAELTLRGTQPERPHA